MQGQALEGRFIGPDLVLQSTVREQGQQGHEYLPVHIILDVLVGLIPHPDRSLTAVALEGQDFLDRNFLIDGARRFGEAAVGTNYNINRFTKNILFDEKFGGTVHMAIGQSYLQTGGKNKSSIHWDMIANMKNGGEIFANDEKIYESGKFLLT